MSSRLKPRAVWVRSLVPNEKKSATFGDPVGLQAGPGQLDHRADQVARVALCVGDPGDHAAHQLELALVGDQRDHHLDIGCPAPGRRRRRATRPASRRARGTGAPDARRASRASGSSPAAARRDAARASPRAGTRDGAGTRAAAGRAGARSRAAVDDPVRISSKSASCSGRSSRDRLGPLSRRRRP